MKRTASLLLILCLLLTLCACGSGESESSSETEASSAPITESESEANDSVVSSLYSAILEDEPEITDRIVVGLAADQTKIYSGKSILLGKTWEFSRDCNGDSLEEYFKIGLNNPNGLKVLAAVENRGVNLAVNFTLNAAFDDAGNIREDYYLQLSFVDLDGDGDEDLLLTIGNLNDLSETLFFRLGGGSFEYAGLIMSGAKLRYDGSAFLTTDDLTYTFDDVLRIGSGEDAEEVPVEITDDALSANLASLVQPLVITVPESFSSPAQLPKDVLLTCALFGYIVNTDPEIRTYSEYEVLIPEADANAQISILFGDTVALNPADYPQSDDAFVYYGTDGNYHMPLAGYYSDLIRVDGLEQTDAGYILTAALIPREDGETYDSLEGMTPSRVVKYTIARFDNRYVVTALENVSAE